MKNLILILVAILFLSCSQEKKPIIKNKYLEAYKSVDSLASLTSKVEASKDTIFMGFQFSMNKKQYRAHIIKLKEEGFDIEFRKDFNYKGINIQNSYLIKTEVTHSENNKKYVGMAGFLLVPKYNEKEGLVELTVISAVDWQGIDPYFRESWFINKLRDEYRAKTIEDAQLDRFVGELNYPSSYASWIGKKNKMNVMSLTNSHIIFSSDKELLRNLFLRKIDEDIAEDQSDKIKF